jgi:hypothetical protein
MPDEFCLVLKLSRHVDGAMFQRKQRPEKFPLFFKNEELPA